MTEYNFPFERIKQIKEQLTGVSDGEKPATEEVKTEEIIETQSDQNKSIIEQLQTPSKQIDLSSI